MSQSARLKADLSPIPWVEALSVGDAAIDAEHRFFIDLVNRLSAMVVQDASKIGINALLHRLIEHSREHFTNEEAILEAAGYPELAAHRDAHQALLGALEAVVQDFLAADSYDRWVAAALHIKTALVDHLLHQDMRFKSHLQERGGR
jgi:hemerythrin